MCALSMAFAQFISFVELENCFKMLHVIVSFSLHFFLLLHSNLMPSIGLRWHFRVDS